MGWAFISFSFRYFPKNDLVTKENTVFLSARGINELTLSCLNIYSSKSYPMNTNLTGFQLFSKIFASLCLGRK